MQPSQAVKFVYPRQRAFDEARRAAARPIEKGGLGLHKDNTAVERAAAMGVDVDAFHGSPSPNITKFNPSLAGKNTGNPFDEYLFATTSPESASGYSLNFKRVPEMPEIQEIQTRVNAKLKEIADAFNAGKRDRVAELKKELDSIHAERKKIQDAFNAGKLMSEGSTVYPLSLRSANYLERDAKGGSWLRNNRTAIEESKDQGYPGAVIRNVRDNVSGPYEKITSDVYASSKPEMIRSRFAAFNPDRRNSTDILAGAVPVSMVTNPDQMTHKPFDRATNPIVSAIRGWAAGTAGLPGDIEGLTRMAAKYLSAPGSLAEKYGMDETRLPTSDFYREWLPGKSEGAGADEIESLGALFGGVGATNIARPLAKLPGAIARAAYVKGGLVHDVTKARILPEREGPNLLTREYPKLSGFLQGLMGRAPDEVGGGSVLDEDAQSSRALQALGAKYGYPIGAIAGVLPFGSGVAKAPSIAAGSRVAQKGIIKTPGGNWLPEGLKALKPLKMDIGPSEDQIRLVTQRKGPEAAEQMRKDILGAEINRPDIAVNDWIDGQLTKYVKNDMATERDPLRLMADAWPEKKAAKLADVQARIDALAARTRQLARERGQPEHTLTEMRQLMIPLEKEKALIEATNALHTDPRPSPRDMKKVWKKREEAGFPTFKGTAPEAQRWEEWSDRLINNPKAEAYQNFGSSNLQNQPGNEWIGRLDPESRLYGVNNPSGFNTAEDGIQSVGFYHLIDELRNSLNPESGLPKELLFKYKDLPKITVPQAVERVAQVNAWRAAQKHEADLLTANNAATVLHKDYPEKGLKWVEMTSSRHSMDKLPEGWSLQEFEGASPGSKIFGVVNSKGHLHPEAAGKQAITPEIAYDNFKSGFGRKELEDALKYEGDQMAHCVGGYCPDVLEGRSRIFSLRDAKGKPHTTIEVNPGEYARADLSEDQFELVRDLARRRGVIPNQSILRQALPELPDPPSRIKQIKGFKNGKPDDEYLPYVQDFVKSGKWSDVGDLENSGLLRASNQVYQHPRDAGEGWMPRFGDLGIDEGYYTNDELVGHIQAARKKAGYASGGLVNVGYNPAFVNARAAQLEAELFN